MMEKTKLVRVKQGHEAPFGGVWHKQGAEITVPESHEFEAVKVGEDWVSPVEVLALPELQPAIAAEEKNTRKPAGAGRNQE
jgi:hypothetical protein